MMHLYTCFPEAYLLDFVNAPLGRGLLVNNKLLPLIAMPIEAL